jgi:hypothetical protein
LRPAPGYSNIRKALIAPYDIGKFPEVSANPQCILIIEVQLPPSSVKALINYAISNLSKIVAQNVTPIFTKPKLIGP